jgi:lipopolysaccharide transport system ATP-binding protein
MEKPIIEVNNLGKRYLLGLGGGERYRALRDVMANSVKNIFKRKYKHKELQEIWALKQITFDVRAGEKVGIIGRNGAGKSTLLKILSEITEPTEGEALIRGRIAGLLEVGTGFHPELTGKENIFMNGAILGMRRAEIKKKFDEIVSFAEIERFLDTPVKRYSSGMYVRLAFAVAAHLEPEILIVDEVLAVGDIAFQKKCLGKMSEVAKGGRTVLFVSHNMEAIKRLCRRTILLSYGKIIEDGNTESTVAKYISEGIRDKTAFQGYIKGLRLDPVFKLHSIEVRQNGAEDPELLRFVASKDIIISFNYEVYEDSPKLFLNFELWDTAGTRLIETFHNGDDPYAVVKKGAYTSDAVIPANSLVHMPYELKIDIGIFGGHNFTKEPISIPFEVLSDGITNMVYGKRPLGGKVALPIRWNTKKV